MTLGIDRSGRTAERGGASVRLGRWHRGLVVAVLCTIGFMTSFDTAGHAIAVPTLLQELGDRPVLHTSIWIPKVYVLAFTAFLMIGGTLADRFGAKRVLLCGGLLFVGGTATHLVLAMTSIPLVVARVFMGAGVAAMFPAALSILTAVSDTALARAGAVTLWSGSCAAGVTVVPLVSGLILNNVWWPRVIGSVGVVAMLMMIGVAVLVPATPADRESPADWPATIAVTLGIGLVMFALIQAPDWGWSSPPVIGTSVAGVVMSVVSAIIRRGGALPHDCFARADPRVRPAMFALGTAWLALFGIVFLIVQYLQAVHGHSPVVAGSVMFLPTCGASVIGAKLGSKVQRRFGMTAALTIGLTAVLDGLAIGLTADAQGDLGPIVAMATVACVGFAMVLSVALDAVSAALPLSPNASAWAATTTAVPSSGLFGLAIVACTVDSGYHAHLVASGESLPFGGVVSSESLGKGVAMVASAGDRDRRQLAAAVQNAFLAGYRHGLLATIAIVAAVMAAILVTAAGSRRPWRSR
ncbi:MFS transporter [Nocardia sp. NEAU-G5]|uniref:MFS transporter n=1 Tax=Nocardia albiluteola TaxID=2842303 RepID=A0ABS6B3I5_9NOCA|nr:MFS transporter [Nocardia albiluteola]MBU3064865.1 MFS transporter [Nocardia albiluteola]